MDGDVKEGWNFSSSTSSSLSVRIPRQKEKRTEGKDQTGILILGIFHFTIV